MVQHDMTTASQQGLPYAQALLQSSLTLESYLIKGNLLEYYLKPNQFKEK